MAEPFGASEQSDRGNVPEGYEIVYSRMSDGNPRLKEVEDVLEAHEGVEALLFVRTPLSSIKKVRGVIGDVEYRYKSGPILRIRKDFPEGSAKRSFYVDSLELIAIRESSEDNEALYPGERSFEDEEDVPFVRED